MPKERMKTQQLKGFEHGKQNTQDSSHAALHAHLCPDAVDGPSERSAWLVLPVVDLNVELLERDEWVDLTVGPFTRTLNGGTAICVGNPWRVKHLRKLCSKSKQTRICQWLKLTSVFEWMMIVHHSCTL